MYIKTANGIYIKTIETNKRAQELPPSNFVRFKNFWQVRFHGAFTAGYENKRKKKYKVFHNNGIYVYIEKEDTKLSLKNKIYFYGY